MALRVAFRITNPTGWTGGVNYILNICRVLRAHAPDVEPVVFAPPQIDPELAKAIQAAAGAMPRPLRDRTRRDDLLAIAGWQDGDSRRAFGAAAIDVVFEATGYYGARPDLPMVSWIPDFQNRRLPHLFSPGQRVVRDLRYRLILANRRQVMVSSQDALGDLRALYGRPAGKVAVIPFALRVDQPATWSDGEAARVRLGLPDRFVFLPNQFWIHKNHRLVVEALGRLEPSRRPVVAASGLGHDPRAPNLVAELKARIAELDLGRHFHMLGVLKFADILALNARADALLNPSLFEGWSTTVEEAKALGTPMVLSDLPVHREQVGGDADFFDPHDSQACAEALAALAARPPRPVEFAAQVARRSLERQKVFADQLRSIFSQAAGRA